MRNIHKKRSIFFTALGTLGVGTWLVAAQAAGSATLTLSPSSGSYQNGVNFTITINENSASEQINTVQADLTYDQSKLQFVSINTAISTFDYPLVASGGGGSVSIARGVSGGGTVSGPQTLAAVTFKVLVGSGSTAVSFAGSSAIVRPSDGQNVWNGSTAGGTYTLTTPPPPPPPPPPGTTPPPPPGTTPPPATTTKPKPSGTTPPPATPNAQTQAANPAAPVPTSRDIAQDKGYLVAIKVVDAMGKPVEKASVKLAGQTADSDSAGIASFAGVPAGQHEAEIKSASVSFKSSVNVLGGKPSRDVQQFEARFPALARSKLPFFVIPPIVIGAAGAMAWYLLKRRSSRGSSTPTTNSQISGGHDQATTPPPVIVYPSVPASDSPIKALPNPSDE